MQRLPQPLQLLALYGLTALSGGIASALAVPLPWMIGPLLASGAVALAGWEAPVPPVTRLLGQVTVAGAIGMTLTATTLGVAAASAAWMVLLGLATLLLGGAVAIIAARLSRLDLGTLCLVCIPAGPIETANIAVRYGLRTGPIVFGQTLRIAMIVLILPPLVVWLENVEVAAAVRPSSTLQWWMVPPFLAWCGVVGMIFARLRIPNAFFLGALIAAALVAATGVAAGGTPPAVLAAGQILLGTWLGTVFSRRQIARARAELPVVVASTVVVMALCCGLGLFVSWGADIEWETMVLAAAPGSLTEMALTAELVHADPVMVTAFHVVRIFIMIPLTSLIFVVFGHRLGSARPSEASPPSDDS